MVLFHSKYFAIDPISYYLFGNDANLFTSFRPRLKNCYPKVSELSLSKSEKDARSVIKTTLISRALLHKDVSDQFINQFLQICTDDPRDVLIYFSARYRYRERGNSFLDPVNNSELLSVLADSFNFRFEEIRSSKDICKTIDFVKKRGRKIAAIILQAHGSPEKGMILSKDQNGNEERVNGSNDLSECLSRISEDGTIVFIGGSIGQNKALNTKKMRTKNLILDLPRLV